MPGGERQGVPERRPPAGGGQGDGCACPACLPGAWSAVRAAGWGGLEGRLEHRTRPRAPPTHPWVATHPPTHPLPPRHPAGCDAVLPGRGFPSKRTPARPASHTLGRLHSHSRHAAPQAATPCSPATASCRRTQSLAGPARRPASPSSAPPPVGSQLSVRARARALPRRQRRRGLRSGRRGPRQPCPQRPTAPPTAVLARAAAVHAHARRTEAPALHPDPACRPLHPGPADTMRMFAQKHTARELAERAQVPVLAGSPLLGSADEALECARTVGLPVLLKATGARARPPASSPAFGRACKHSCLPARLPACLPPHSPPAAAHLPAMRAAHPPAPTPHPRARRRRRRHRHPHLPHRGGGGEQLCVSGPPGRRRLWRLG